MPQGALVIWSWSIRWNATCPAMPSASGGLAAAACPRPPGHAADPPGPTTRESEEPEAERSRHLPGEEGRDCRRGRGDEVANEDSQAMCVRGIPHPARSSKRRLTTQAGDYSPEGEIARPRVQAGAESGKMRRFLCPRTKAYQLGIAHLR